MKEKKLEVKKIWQWKWMEYLSYLIIIGVPLYFNTKHWSAFSSPKTLTLSALVLLMVIFYAWGVIVSKKFIIKLTPLHIVLGIFLIILTISSIFGMDPHNSFFGVFDFPTNLIFIYIISIFACFIGFLVKNNKKFLLQILLISFLTSIIVVFFSYTDSLFKIFEDYSSTIGDSSYAGAYLLFNACFGIGLFFYYKKYWQKILIGIGTLFIMFCPLFFNIDILLGKIRFLEITHNPILLFGVANGAAIGLAISIIVIFSFFLLFSSKKLNKIIGIVILFTLLVSIIYTGYKLTDSNSKIYNIYVADKTENRFIAWGIAKRSLGDHFWLGSGSDNYVYNYQKYLPPAMFKSKYPETYFYKPHNVFWEYASNNGILGLISYLSLLFFTFFALFKYKKQENEENKDNVFRIIFIGILFGYFIQNLFVFDTVTTYLMFFLIIGLAIGFSIKNWTFEITNKFKNIKNIIAVFIIFLCFVFYILFVFLPWKESLRWGQFNSTDNITKLKDIRKGMQEISLFGGVEDSSYLAIKLFNYYLLNLDKVDDSNRKIFTEEIDSLVGQVENDTKNQPNDLRAYFAMGELLSLKILVNNNEVLDKNVWDKSYYNFKKALNLNSENPKIYLAFAQLYMLKMDFVNARISIKQAIGLAPEYKEIYKVAEELQKIAPDKDFEDYINSREGV